MKKTNTSTSLSLICSLPVALVCVFSVIAYADLEPIRTFRHPSPVNSLFLFHG